MRCVTAQVTNGCVKPLKQSWATHWLAGGLLASSLVGQIGGAIQGWPIIVAQQQAEMQMIGLMAAGGLALILVVSMIGIYAMSSSTDEDEYARYN